MRRCLTAGSCLLLLCLPVTAQKIDINLGTKNILSRSRGGTGVNASAPLAQTGVDINTNFQVTALHLAGPTLCSVGQSPRGIDTQGNATGCAAIGGGSVSLNVANLWTKTQTFQPDTDVPAIIAKQANVATPTADLAQFQDKTGTVLSRVKSDGSFQVGASSATLNLGASGAPVGACNNGSLYTDATGGAGSTLYVCEGGTWAAK